MQKVRRSNGFVSDACCPVLRKPVWNIHQGFKCERFGDSIKSMAAVLASRETRAEPTR